MANTELTGAPVRADHAVPTATLPPAALAAMHRLEKALPAPSMSEADRLAHEAASYVRPTPRPVADVERRDVRTAVSGIRGW